MAETDIWAVVPIKETGEAKQRLADFVPAHLLPGLALAMFEDVMVAKMLEKNGIEPTQVNYGYRTSALYHVFSPFTLFLVLVLILSVLSWAVT